MVKASHRSKKQGGFATYGLIILMTMVFIIWQGVSREVLVASATLADERAYREGYYRAEAASVILLGTMQETENFRGSIVPKFLYRDGDWTYYYDGTGHGLGDFYNMKVYAKKEGDFHRHYRKIFMRMDAEEDGRTYYHILRVTN